MPIIPDEFARFVSTVFDTYGQEWVQRLPDLLAECERRWALQIQAPFELSYNYVAPAIRADGSQVVVKAGVVGGPHRELLTEMDALRFYSSHGSVRLLEADAELGTMLLERLRPGHDVDRDRR